LTFIQAPQPSGFEVDLSALIEQVIHDQDRVLRSDGAVDLSIRHCLQVFNLLAESFLRLPA
jgi:hypothetical protein